MHFDRPEDFVKYRMHIHDRVRETPYEAVSRQQALDSLRRS